MAKIYMQTTMNCVVVCKYKPIISICPQRPHCQPQNYSDLQFANGEFNVLPRWGLM